MREGLASSFPGFLPSLAPTAARSLPLSAPLAQSPDPSFPFALLPAFFLPLGPPALSPSHFLSRLSKPFSPLTAFALGPVPPSLPPSQVSSPSPLPSAPPWPFPHSRRRSAAALAPSSLHQSLQAFPGALPSGQGDLGRPGFCLPSLISAPHLTLPGHPSLPGASSPSRPSSEPSGKKKGKKNTAGSLAGPSAWMDKGCSHPRCPDPAGFLLTKSRSLSYSWEASGEPCSCAEPLSPAPAPNPPNSPPTLSPTPASLPPSTPEPQLL
jgi:hypothetical protein